LRQVAVHIAVLPTKIIAEGRCGRGTVEKSEKSKTPRVASWISEFVEIHTLEHPGTRRDPFYGCICAPEVFLHVVLYCGAAGRLGDGGSDNELVVVRARVRVRHLQVGLW
jgi:hypothetical protein